MFTVFVVLSDADRVLFQHLHGIGHRLLKRLLLSLICVDVLRSCAVFQITCNYYNSRGANVCNKHQRVDVLLCHAGILACTKTRVEISLPCCS